MTMPFDLSDKEAAFLLALLESNKQTALQLLAAEHFYQPSLLPRLRKFTQEQRRQSANQD
jgi:hypothetical protein